MKFRICWRRSRERTGVVHLWREGSEHGKSLCGCEIPPHFYAEYFAGSVADHIPRGAHLCSLCRLAYKKLRRRAAPRLNGLAAEEVEKVRELREKGLHSYQIEAKTGLSRERVAVISSALR